MTIKIINNGPILVDNFPTTITIFDAEGKIFNTKEKPTIALCRCGLSANKPFCDGKHKGVFVSEVKAQ
jgi:CDGSH-type Zn-finger protein